jgi:hypothetical protein
MATTTNYGWTTPDDTALVKDGAAAIRTLGSSIDTSLNTALGTKKAGLVLLNTTSFSGVTSQSVSDVFSATYLNYLILINMDEVATSGNLGVRLRVSGSDAATNYNSMIQGIDTASSALAIAGAALTSAQYTNQNAGANSKSYNVLNVGAPFIAAPTQITVNSATRRNGGNWSGYYGAINHTDNTSYTGFTLLNSAGGNIQGVVRTYGVNI